MKTRDKIITTAAELLQTRSAAGFSFQDVADIVGIRKASIYSHFKSKDAVIEAVLDAARADLAAAMQACAERPPADQLRWYVQYFRGLHHGAERMCPGGSFGSIWSVAPPRLQLAVEALGNLQFTWLTALFEAGRTSGDIVDSGRSARADAEYAFAAMQGALLSARLLGSARVFDNVAERLLEQFIVS